MRVEQILRSKETRIITVRLREPVAVAARLAGADVVVVQVEALIEPAEVAHHDEAADEAAGRPPLRVQ